MADKTNKTDTRRREALEDAKQIVAHYCGGFELEQGDMLLVSPDRGDVVRGIAAVKALKKEGWLNALWDDNRCRVACPTFSYYPDGVDVAPAVGGDDDGEGDDNGGIAY